MTSFCVNVMISEPHKTKLFCFKFVELSLHRLENTFFKLIKFKPYTK